MELDAVSLCLIRLVNYLKRERFKKMNGNSHFPNLVKDIQLGVKLYKIVH